MDFKLGILPGSSCLSPPACLSPVLTPKEGLGASDMAHGPQQWKRWVPALWMCRKQLLQSQSFFFQAGSLRRLRWQHHGRQRGTGLHWEIPQNRDEKGLFIWATLGHAPPPHSSANTLTVGAWACPPGLILIQLKSIPHSMRWPQSGFLCHFPFEMSLREFNWIPNLQYLITNKSPFVPGWPFPQFMFWLATILPLWCQGEPLMSQPVKPPNTEKVSNPLGTGRS